MRYGSGALVAAVAGAALVLPGVAGATPRQDWVTGTVIGQHGGGTPLTYHIDARSGSSGENPTGQITANGPEGGTPTFAGPVTCLNVQGNVALLKFQSTQSDSGIIGLLSVRITDNAGSTTPDLVEVEFATGASDECASPEPSYILHSTVISGDVVVVDDSKCREKFKPNSKKPICPAGPPPPDDGPPT